MSHVIYPLLTAQIRCTQSLVLMVIRREEDEVGEVRHGIRCQQRDKNQVTSRFSEVIGFYGEVLSPRDRTVPEPTLLQMRTALVL